MRKTSPGIEPIRKSHLLMRLRRYIEAARNDNPDRLKEHQIVGLERIVAFLRLPKGGRYGIAYSEDAEGKEKEGIKKDDFFEIIAATGIGKTRMFGALCKGGDMQALILTPRNLLNKQALKEFCKELDIDPNQVGIYDSKQPPYKKAQALQKRYLICTYQSLPLLQRRGYDFGDREGGCYRPLVILDEVHKALGPVTSNAIKTLMKHSIVAGFTATDAGAGRQLFQGQKPIYDLPVKKALRQGIICNGIRTGVIDVDIHEDWIKNFCKVSKDTDYRQEDVHRFATYGPVIQGAIDFHLTHNDPQLGKIHRLPTVFFTQGIDAARKGADVFNLEAQRLGVSARADYISGEMPDKVRDAKLHAFRRGDIQALWNDSVLEVGFDDENASVCYSLRPSALLHVPEQQMGRIARAQGYDYVKKYGHDKVGLAFNLRAPGMNPVLFGEALGNKASVYADGYTPPEKNPAGPESWPPHITVHTEENDVQKQIDKARFLRDPSIDSDMWLNQSRVTFRSHGNSAAIIRLWQQVKQSLAQGEGELQDDGLTTHVTVGDKLYRTRVIQDSVCIHSDDIMASGLIRTAFAGIKRKAWWTEDEINTNLPANQREAAATTLGRIKTALENQQGEPQLDGSIQVTLGGRPVRTRTIDGKLAVHTAEFSTAVTQPPRRDSTSEWWNLSNATFHMDIKNTTKIFKELWDKLANLIEQGQGIACEDGSTLLEIDGKKFHAQYMKCNTSRSLCVRKEDIEAAYADVPRRSRAPSRPIDSRWNNSGWAR